MELNSEQREIIKHTIKTGIFCGGGKDMDALCDAGLMEYAGKKSFVPDPYYRATAAGKQALTDWEVKQWDDVDTYGPSA